MTFALPPRSRRRSPQQARRSRGVSLIVVLLILVVVSILGVSGIQVAMMGERGTRNDRDQQIAWQAAEAALMDAEFDIEGLPASSTSKRNAIFKLKETQIEKVQTRLRELALGSGYGSVRIQPHRQARLAHGRFHGHRHRGTHGAIWQPRGATPSGSKGVQRAPPRYMIEEPSPTHGLPHPIHTRNELCVPRHGHGLWPQRRERRPWCK